jgi:hypothetical protein
VDLPEDLLKPRSNPEIDTTIRAIRKDVYHLTREKDHTARWGYARVLIAQLEHLLESSAFLPPLLCDGLVEEPDDWLADGLLKGRGLAFLKERPFETSGPSSDRFFIEFNGRLSPLFSNLPADDGPFMGFAGPWVHVHQLLHTTGTVTLRRLTEAESLERVTALIPGRLPGHDRSGYRLVLDPKGYERRRGAVPPSLVLCALPELASATRLADELSETLRIRLVVTAQVRLIDNH